MKHHYYKQYQTNQKDKALSKFEQDKERVFSPNIKMPMSKSFTRERKATPPITTL